MKPLIKKWGYLIPILLGLSFLFADTKIPFLGPIVFYPPELAIYLIFGAIAIDKEGRSSLLHSWQELSPLVKWSLGLYLVGGVIGIFVSPLFPQSIGAFKAWIFAPLILAWLIFSLKAPQRKNFVLYGLTAYGLALTLLAFGQVVQHGLTMRATDYFTSPNYLSAVLFPVAVLLGWEGYTEKSWFYLTASVLIFIAGLLTHSLGGLVGAILALCFAYFYVSKPLKTVLIIIGIILLIGSSALLIKRSEGAANSLNGRLQIWQVAAYFVNSWPVTGDGLRGFEHDYPNYVGDLIHGNVQEWSVPQPHNLGLSLWLSVGLPGLLGFIGLMIAALKWGLRPSSPQLAIIAILGHGLIDTPYWRIDLCSLLWVLLAIQLAREKDAKTK